MKKHLLQLLFAAMLFAACNRDQVEPLPEPSLVPYAIYEVNNANFDTSAPRNVTEYTYTSQGYISSLRERIYTGNQFDRTSYFEYNQQGEVLSMIHNNVEWTRYNYFFQNGKVRYTTSNYGSSEFLFDGANRMLVRIDTSGPRGNSYRADSLLYNYTDSGVTIRRIIQMLRNNTIGEAQANYIFFDRTIRNPFDRVQSDHQSMPFALIGLIDNLRFKNMGFVSMFKMVDRTGGVDFRADFKVEKRRQGSDYPELIKVNYNSFGSPSEFYLYILYREL